MSKGTCDLLFYDSMQAPLAGTLWLAATEHGLCAVTFGGDEKTFVADLEKTWAYRPIHDHSALAEAEQQIGDYLSGKRTTFAIPLDLRAVSPFQRQVLEATMSVERGHTISYKALAEQVGKPGAVRAVGGAQARNPLPIVIPCHRVVGADGRLTGYGGGLDLKQALLRLEGALPH